MADQIHYLEQELTQLLQTDSGLFRFLESSTLDGLWFWDLENPDNEWFSEGFWKTLGFDPAGKKHLASEWQDLINPDDLKLSLENFHAHCADPSHPYDQVVRYRHQDGSTVWVRCRGMAIRNAAGKPIRMLGAHTDITSQKNIEERYLHNLKSLEQQYAETRLALEEIDQLFHAMPDAVLQVDADGNIVRANSAATTLFGYSQQTLSSMKVEQLIPKQHREGHIRHRQAYSADPSIREMGQRGKEFFCQTKSGAQVPVEIKLSPVKTRFGMNTIAVVRDISENESLKRNLEKTRRVNKDLYSQATTDSLTGINNRACFNERAAVEFLRARRLFLKASVMMIDIDDFKRINDELGHLQGDLVLKKVADLIKGNVREYDIFARYGGEEFVVYMPETAADTALEIAERIIHTIRNHRDLDEIQGMEKLPTLSIGLAELEAEDYSLTPLIERADNALYDAKRSGKNRAIVYSRNH
ncbi:GGDEF domain-containing protein [Neptuniibacter halophilus]|uniref:GGDEF domain-containing protein n=1 Tax=Neptuniibacter halophilus TaxID=651666 RepID=UPI002572F839|nr:sensor domain-containing diguanylate cyclase [Neptuniibacter halophilus]